MDDDAVSHPGGLQLGTLVDQLREGFQVVGADFRYLYVNDAVCEQGRVPREGLLGHTMMEVYPGIEQTNMFANIDRCRRERVLIEMENEFTYTDGTIAWFELRMEPVPEGVAILSLDVTERHVLEEQLRHAQKMEAVGRLAGGLAHDFNNLLTAILNFTLFARETLPEGHEAVRDLDQVLAASVRAESLVRQLLALSRRRTIEPKVVDVDDLVANLEAMLRGVVGSDVDLQTTLAGDLWPVCIDPGACEQVLVNLAVNARDAMPDGGTLTVETGNVKLDDSYQMAKDGLVEPGDYVVLAVTDTGVGMDAETRTHLFEPYFTTQPVGKGTGLGLSTCFGIVEQAGGHLWVYSELGEGTVFKIYLPRVHARPPGEAVAHVADGHETVLVVEDEPLVRELVVRTLEQHGYRVLAAESAGSALERARAEPGSVDLLLTDVVMPETGGPDLARRIRAICPGLRVLFMSGYTRNAIVHEGVLDEGVHLVQKPFTPEGLAAKVREALDEPRE